MPECIKKPRHNYMLSTKPTLYMKPHIHEKGQWNIYYDCTNQKIAGIAILISNMAEFRLSKVVRANKGHYIIKGHSKRM